MRVAVLIVVYNGERYITNLCQSLARTQLKAATMDVIVVDNASTDGSLELLRPQSVITHLIRNTTNSGFAEGNNQAWQWAQSRGYDYVVLLNQDTTVTPLWLEGLLTVATSQARAGAVQAKLLLMQQPERVNSVGNRLHYLGYGFSAGEGGVDSAAPQAVQAINYASGAAVLFSVPALNLVGLFYNDYFAYHEDTDVCWRLRLAGYEIYLAPQAVVYHDYHWAPKDYHYFYIERNRLLLLWSNYRYATLVVLAPLLFVVELGQLLMAWRQGWARQLWRAWQSFWSLLPTAIVWHRRAAQLRRVSDRQLIGQWARTIDFPGVSGGLLQMVGNPVFRLYYYFVRLVVWW